MEINEFTELYDFLPNVEVAKNSVKLARTNVLESITKVGKTIREVSLKGAESIKVEGLPVDVQNILQEKGYYVRREPFTQNRFIISWGDTHER